MVVSVCTVYQSHLFPFYLFCHLFFPLFWQPESKKTYSTRDLCVIWAAGVLHMQLVSLSRVNINTESSLLAFSQVFRTDSGYFLKVSTSTEWFRCGFLTVTSTGITARAGSRLLLPEAPMFVQVKQKLEWIKFTLAECVLQGWCIISTLCHNLIPHLAL